MRLPRKVAPGTPSQVFSVASNTTSSERASGAANAIESLNARPADGRAGPALP